MGRDNDESPSSKLAAAHPGVRADVGHAAHLVFGRIVVSDIEAPILLANLV